MAIPELDLQKQVQKMQHYDVFVEEGDVVEAEAEAQVNLLKQMLTNYPLGDLARLRQNLLHY
jgi:hypothetical protein